MRRPTSSSIHSSYRPLFQPGSASPYYENREGSLARRLSIRDRNRRGATDNLIFNPLRRPRDRIYQEFAERHRAAARARNAAATEPNLGREEKAIRCNVLETDGGSYQSSTGVRNVSADDDSVYCSYKKNNVNILFEHAISTAPFELTRIIIKTPSIGYSSPVREGFVYVSMKPIKFKDTDRYDRPDVDEVRAASLFESFGINCLEGRRDPGARPTRQKEENGESSPPTVTIPVIPQWGSPLSGKRVETEPVAKFTFARNSTSTEIVFNPPITGRYILMKLFNNTHGDHPERDMLERPIPLEPPEPLTVPSMPPHFLHPPDPLRFDVIEDELEDPDSTFTDTQGGGDAEFENVDVQAILFYGHTGRRCFPSTKAL